MSTRWYQADRWQMHASTLVVDAFRGIVRDVDTTGERAMVSRVASPSLPVANHALGSVPPLTVLSVPWAAVSYASRRRPPSDLAYSSTAPWVLQGDEEAWRQPRLCAFMGRRRGAWRLQDQELRKLVPGYLYRDRLVQLLNCSHLQPHDRNAVRHGRDGATQTGPFEGTLAHYAGYRFIVAVENTDVGSPVSEKAVNAFLAGAVPIVWGGGRHRHTFNPASFLDCTALSVQRCATEVRSLDADSERLRAMLSAPRFETPAHFNRFFAWSEAARGSRQQKRMLEQLANTLPGLSAAVRTVSKLGSFPKTGRDDENAAQ